VIKIVFGNWTGLEFFDIPRQLIETEFLGTTEFAAVFVLVVAIIALLMTDARKEAIALVPLPIAVVLAEVVSGLLWVKVVIYILMGAWLGIVIMRLMQNDT